ncbi:MAG: class D beta-lactamase [Bacteroidia bacterium]
MFRDKNQISNIKYQISSVLFLLCFYFNSNAQLNEVHNEWGAYFEKFKVKGSCVIYDLKKDKYYFYNRAQFTVPTTPASTFKILNSLIALQTSVAPDENFILKWDGKDRGNEAWNKDTDMKTAFKNSTVWYYQELARRAGEKRMKKYVKKAHYGNKDISGGIDQFWLTGGLRITPQQQIEFLVKLYKNKLPFKKHNIEIVKNIMIQEDTLGYVLRGKTGWGTDMKTNIGWYVGYVTKGDNIFFFATRIQDDAMENKDFSKSRLIITRRILRDLKVIPEPEQE